MPVYFNHTIVHARDKRRAAAFLAGILDLPAPRVFGPFMAVDLDDGSSLDFIDSDGDFDSLHIAFLVGEDDFDGILGRIRAGGVPHWADPARATAGEINTHDGGRGVYFEDPGGHFFEAITRPYGSGTG